MSVSQSSFSVDVIISFVLSGLKTNVPNDTIKFSIFCILLWFLYSH